MHHRGVGAQPPAVTHAEIEGRADDDDDVGFLEGIAPGAMEIVGIARRQESARRTVHVARNVEALEQGDGLLVPPAGPNLGTQKNGRAFGFHQKLRQLLDVGGVADGLGRGPVASRLRDDSFIQRHFRVEYVAGNLEITRPGGTGEALARGHGDHIGDALGGAHARGEFGDRGGDIHMGQVLKGTHLVLGERALPADVKHRAL